MTFADPSKFVRQTSMSLTQQGYILLSIYHLLRLLSLQASRIMRERPFTLVGRWLIGHQGNISPHETFVSSFRSLGEIRDSGEVDSPRITPMGEMLCIELKPRREFLALRDVNTWSELSS